jgi:hypothetical protein
MARRLSALFQHPEFNKLSDQGQKSLLFAEGLPRTVAGDAEPLADLLERARAFAITQEVGDSAVLREDQRRRDPGLLSRLGRGMVTAGKQAMLPIAGGFVGRVAAPFVGLPPQVGESLGSVAGEGINQLSGLTLPSVQQLMLAAGGPALGRQASRVLPSVPVTLPRDRLLSGATKIPGGGGALAELAAEDIRALPRALEARTAATLGEDTMESLFQSAREGSRAAAGGATAPPALLKLPATRQVAATLRRLEREAPPSVRLGGEYAAILKDINNISKAGGAVPLPLLDTFRRRVGAVIGKSSDLNDEQSVFLRRVYGGFLDDLGAAAADGIPQADALLRATQAARREFATQDLDRLIEKVGFGLPRPDGVPNLRIGALLREVRAIDKDTPSRALRLFKSSVDPDEFSQIKETLEFWNARSAVILPPAGAQYGSGPTNIAAAAAYAATGSGQAAAAVVAGRQVLARLLLSQNGRQALKQLISQDQVVNFTDLFAVAATQMGREALGADPVSLGRAALDRMRAPGEQRLEAPPAQ